MLTEAEAEKHPLRNVITRALGGALQVNPDASEIKTKPGDVFLLCSDGLTGMLKDDTIQHILMSERDLDRAVGRLITAANEEGGVDNISVVLARIEAG